MKTNKSFSKRIRVTRKGKLVVRKAGQDHFNAKESSSTKGTKKRAHSLKMGTALRRRFLPGSPNTNNQ
ncbi:MAG: 50S ribosomal protein L35 [Candidatus Pacebacteria bacterium]|nr:50S ribosomal protein L35 [Candidatus Paceibacterota bacterium]